MSEIPAATVRSRVRVPHRDSEMTATAAEQESAMDGSTLVYILDGPDNHKIVKRMQCADADAASWHAGLLAEAGITAWTE